jgi:PAS domain S-box-containing protein
MAMTETHMQHLRSQVQTRIQRLHADLLPTLSAVEIRALWHELEVHQAELELQNEQLQESQWKLQETLEKYRELYESIPIGYATIDSSTQIIDCNPAGRTLLGTAQATPLYFSQHLCSEDADRSVLLCRRVISTRTPARCELSLVRSDGSRFVVAIECFAVMPFEEKRLAIAFQDVTAQADAENTLRANQAELQTLARRLFAAQEEERQRISRDVHDDYCQRVTAMLSEAQCLEKVLKSDAYSSDTIGRLKKTLTTLLTDLRLMAHTLRPLNLDCESLSRSIQLYLDEFAKETDVKITFRSTHVDQLPSDVNVNLYRVLQEALGNVAKHAHATTLDVHLTRTVNGIELTISDDGQGFDLKQVLQQRRGTGLISMQERVRHLGGKIAIESRSQKGTSIQVSIRQQHIASNGN